MFSCPGNDIKLIRCILGMTLNSSSDSAIGKYLLLLLLLNKHFKKLSQKLLAVRKHENNQEEVS